MKNYALFYESVDGDRKYGVDDFEIWLKTFFKSGIFYENFGTKLGIINTLLVGSGTAFINGRLKKWATTTYLKIENNTSSSPRYDAVVVRRDDNIRDFELLVVKGTPGAGKPSPVRTGGMYDLVIAYVKVNAYSDSTTAELEDTRANTNLCGYVAAVVEQLDFQDLQDQFNTFISTYRNTVKNITDEYTDDIERCQEEAEDALQKFVEGTGKSLQEYIDTIGAEKIAVMDGIKADAEGFAEDAEQSAEQAAQSAAGIPQAVSDAIASEKPALIEDVRQDTMEAARTAESQAEYAKTQGDYAKSQGQSISVELEKKVDKVTGKGLSTNDFTNADKEKLDSLTPGGGGLMTRVDSSGRPQWSDDEGKTWHFFSVGNATAANVLSGKTFSNAASGTGTSGTGIVGTMTNRGSLTKTVTPTTSKQTFSYSAGYYSGGTLTVNAMVIPESHVLRNRLHSSLVQAPPQSISEVLLVDPSVVSDYDFVEFVIFQTGEESSNSGYPISIVTRTEDILNTGTVIEFSFYHTITDSIWNFGIYNYGMVEVVTNYIIEVGHPVSDGPYFGIYAYKAQ